MMSTHTHPSILRAPPKYHMKPLVPMFSDLKDSSLIAVGHLCVHHDIRPEKHCHQQKQQGTTNIYRYPTTPTKNMDHRSIYTTAEHVI
jgi:hypothetical protein